MDRLDIFFFTTFINLRVQNSHVNEAPEDLIRNNDTYYCYTLSKLNVYYNGTVSFNYTILQIIIFYIVLYCIFFFLSVKIVLCRAQL